MKRQNINALMEPRIETSPEKKLIGRKMTMSLSNDRTDELWKSFMPGRKEIQSVVGSAFYSIKVYEPLYFDDFKPGKEFEKWAAVEVMDFGSVPDEMETYTLPKGLYAVFHYKGSSTDSRIFQYIFTSWLPNSSYLLGATPHFEILGEKYKNGETVSEEEIWIPIRPKG